ncbi:MAG TPA: OmpA family protein, partial [Psychromonas sp.]
MNSKKSISQKSAIGIVILSVITGGIITLQDHFNKGYLAEKNHIEQIHNYVPIETISLAESDDIAVHAQSNLMIAEPLDITQQPSKERVLFALASAEIKPAFFAALSVTAKRIKMAAKDKQAVWQIVGHSDHSGTAQFNLKLAKQRAQAVADFLLDKGVEAKQISVLSLGESFPVKLDPIRTSNPLDRRVEIHPYQAEIAALAKQLNRKIHPAGLPEKKVGQLKAPITEQLSSSALSATGFALKHRQGFAL